MNDVSAMGDVSEILRAIARGVAFLESAQLPSGEIPIEIASAADMSGESSRQPCVFPAALTARVLSVVPSAERVRSRALDFLQREMSPDGLWRHPGSEYPLYLDTPLDLDDTAIASTAFRAAGRPVPDNRGIVLAHRDGNGLFLTWIVRWWRHPIRTCRFFFWHRIAEMGDVDAVINANVVIYLGVRDETRPAIQHMIDVLRANREMMSTVWYGNPFIVWYFFSQALHEIAPEAGEMIVPRVESAIEGVAAAAAPVSALDLALASSTLLLWNRVPDVAPLLDAQLPSGAWPRAGFYHMGRRRDEAQPKPPWWGSEALTTVFAVEALSRLMTLTTRRGNSAT